MTEENKKTEKKPETKKAETGKAGAGKTEKLEREYIIPLRKEWRKVPGYKRANKAVKAIKQFLVRHMKIRDRDLNKVKLDRFLNELLWSRGIKNPPDKVAVKVVKEGEIAMAELSKMPERLKFKKAREEKIYEKADKKAKEKKKGEIPEEEKVREEGEREKSKEEEKEKEEKKAAVVEAGKQMAKQAAKKNRHQTVAKKRDSLPFRRKAMMK